LWAAPLFTLVAVATLALGIGANSSIFSIVNAVVFRPLPFPESEKLMAIGVLSNGRYVSSVSPMNFLDIQATSKTFQSMAAIETGGLTLTDQGAPATLRGAGVSASFFDVIGIRPEQGRAFHTDENVPAKSLVVVLGHELWKNRFGSDPATVGKKIRIDSQLYEVVGIAPPGLSYPEGTELWMPLLHDERFLTKSRGAWYLNIVGRLKDGVGQDAANQEIATIVARLAKDYPDANEGLGGKIISLHEFVVGDTRSGLMLLLGAVGLVLLIACVNVANLMMGRLAARESEFAVRLAMGASRARMFRQLMTESLVLAGLGGAAGVALASATLKTLLTIRPADIPRLDQAAIDVPVMVFAAAATLLTAVLFGAMPALRAWRPAALALREGGRGLSSASSGRVRSALVIGQMALAMMLLAGAGLLARSFAQLQSVKPGFDTSNALTFNLSLPDVAYKTEEGRAAFFDRLMPRLEALPGAGPAGATLGLPLNRRRFNITFEIRDNPPLPPAQQPSMEMRPVTAGYFKAMGIPIVRGRSFESGDVLSSPQVVIISEAAAKKYFPNENPIGRWITMGYGRDKDKPRPGGEIVGVAADVKDRGLAFAAWPEIYLPFAQLPISSMDVLLRTQGDPMALAKAVEGVVHELDREMPLSRVRSFETLVAASISQPRFYALLLGFFATVAVSLAALGIFGVMSYSVVQRSREIGVRLALGAAPSQVRAMVLRQAMVLVFAGVAGGILGALALSKTISGLLFQLSPTDPSTLAGVAALLSVVAFVASYLPARQATRVDPLITLRSE
jgi:putative ABC transport system permease protein